MAISRTGTWHCRTVSSVRPFAICVSDQSASRGWNNYPGSFLIPPFRCSACPWPLSGSSAIGIDTRLSTTKAPCLILHLFPFVLRPFSYFLPPFVLSLFVFLGSCCSLSRNGAFCRPFKSTLYRRWGGAALTLSIFRYTYVRNL